MSEDKKSSSLVEKSESLAEKMNRLTAKFGEHLNDADELQLAGDDVIEYVEEKTKSVSLYTEEDDYASQIVNFENMVQDFKYVRETLKENIENGRRVLNSVTLDLLDADEESRASLIMAFAQLNSAISSNSKIYLSSYKQISEVIINLDKVKKKEKEVFESENGKNVTENHLHIHGEPISTVDLIKKLANKD